MSDKVQICTVLNHIDEREAFWTVFAVPEQPLGMRVAVGAVGVGDTEDDAIASFRLCGGLLHKGIEVEVARRNNVNIEVHEGGDRS
jgi:hypothetical protein